MGTRATTDLAAQLEQGGPAGLGEIIERLIQVAAEGTTRDLLYEATTDITRLLGQRGSCILLEDGPRVVSAPHAPSAIDLRLDLDRYPEIVAAIERREVVTIDDVRRDPRLERVRHLLPAELRSVSAVPLARAGRCLGTFLVQSTHPVPASVEARTAASLLAKFTALILSERSHAENSNGVGLVNGGPAVDSKDGVGNGVPLIAYPPALLPESESGSIPKRILIVEDDPGLKQTLADSLEEEGFFVTTASTGEEGLAKAAAIRPSMLLLDVKLPVLDGFQLARRARETETLRTLPILFLSGADDLAARVRAAQMDDVDFLSKPFSRDELMARVHRVLEQGAGRDRLRVEAQHDELTGLGNRRSLRAALAGERARFERYGLAFSVLVFDIDKLKRINDEHGHLAGDAVIKAVADVLRREGRETDRAVRYGGDEFVVLLPHTSGDDAMVFASRTLGHVARLNPGGIPVTVSVGIASLKRTVAGDIGDDVIRRADAAAYRAKRAGGNRVFRDETG
ncbi:MAG TPA: diguanylate cyclase [Polyangia bacterium]|jgi:diguanylate cyclase (GGDEF)-like protein